MQYVLVRSEHVDRPLPPHPRPDVNLIPTLCTSILFLRFCSILRWPHRCCAGALDEATPEGRVHLGRWPHDRPRHEDSSGPLCIDDGQDDAGCRVQQHHAGPQGTKGRPRHKQPAHLQFEYNANVAPATPNGPNRRKMRILLMAAKQGPNVLFCMPDRTNGILLVSVMQGVRGRLKLAQSC
jgi:hypothetical protein